MIPRDKTRIPKPLSNPAVSLLGDTIDHFELTQAQAADGMGVRRSQLNETLKGKRGVSVEMALRAEAFLGVSAELLSDLQAKYDFQKAYDAKKDVIEESVVRFSDAV